MGISQDGPASRQRGLVTAIGYLVLFVLGGLQGLIGSFQYGDSPVPVIAVLLDLLILATCVLAGWGLRTYGAGIFPAIGWLVASFVLASPRSNGSVIITASPAGEWYLYGGALAAAAGAASAFLGWIRTRRAPRLGPRLAPGQAAPGPARPRSRSAPPPSSAQGPS